MPLRSAPISQPVPRTKPRSTDETRDELHMPEISDDTPADIVALGAQPRCRDVLCYLLQQDRPRPLSEIAYHITVQESKENGLNWSSKLYTEVHESLTHEHIPRLCDAGVVVQKQLHEETLLTLTHRIRYLKPTLQPYTLTPDKYHID
jgi:hypothetical protein